jgi:hypothetical protein
VELQPILSVLPPFAATADKGRSFRKAQGLGDGEFLKCREAIAR